MRREGGVTDEMTAVVASLDALADGIGDMNGVQREKLPDLSSRAAARRAEAVR